jgi:NAD dependent epimerase/dehydratase family enzyme
MAGPRLLFGRELADALLLTSQRVIPAVLSEHGFEFAHPKLDAALTDLLR